MSQRLQDYDSTRQFPAHVHEILNPGASIRFSEIICRLLHACMIETGFVPVIDEGPDIEAHILDDKSMMDSVPKLVESLQRIIDKVGNLHSVIYCGICPENTYHEDSRMSLMGENDESSHSQEHFECSNTGSSHAGNLGSNISLTLKDSGDGFSLITGNTGKQMKDDNTNESRETPVAVKKVYSDKIFVTIIHDGDTIFAVANGPSFHKNFQISFPQYIRPRNIDNFPFSAKFEDYCKLINFSAIRFVEDVKRGFCYPIMDQIGALSFDIRSLSWFPPEIIEEIAKRCGSVAMLRLRATCSVIRNALSDTNQHFWKWALRRDFPQCNTDHLKTDVSPDKYYKKYKEMWNYTYQRPLRRAAGRILFPYYLLSNFRL